MKILVVGAGATGGYFGARLQQAGRDVTFLVRPRRAQLLRERGLRITGPADSVVTPRLVTAPDLDGEYDLVLVSVKAMALPAAIDDVTRAVGPGTTIVPFLNGMAHMDALNEAFGPEAVLGSVVRVFTTVADNGDIVQLAPPSDIVIGEQAGGPSPRVRDIEDVLTGAGFDVTVSADITTAMWHKWVFISTLGALNTLVRASVGDAVAAKGGDQLGPALAAEAAAVSAAAGHPVPAQTMQAIAASTTVPGSTDTASLYRDLVGGRPTEAEHIFGDLTARARALGVPTPLLDLATLSLRVHEARLAHSSYPPAGADMNRDPVSVVRQFLEIVRSGADPGRADRFMASEVVAHQVRAEDPATITRTPREYAEHVEEMLAAYGPFRLEIDELFGSGDKVYARWTQHGAHLGDVDGHAPTGRPITQVTSCVYRVADGRIAEYWIQIDRWGLQAQLDLP
jgi:2-dehydropantoate 2-reductase